MGTSIPYLALVAFAFYGSATAFSPASNPYRTPIRTRHGDARLSFHRTRSSSLLTLFSSKPPTPDFFKGAPSTPGFRPGQFDKLSSWATSTASNRPIVAEYEPDGLWLWTQWDGTILTMTFKYVIASLLWALVVDLYAYQHYTFYIIATAAVNGGDVGSLIDNLSWVSFEIPHSKDPFIETLTALGNLWEYQLSLTTFTLSFFVNHAYSSWRSVYFCTRAIQGRLNDLCMLVTMAAKRTAPYGDVDGSTGYETKIDVCDKNIVTETDSYRDAKRLVQDVTRMLRMSHTFFWASHPTGSDGLEEIIEDNDGLPHDFDATDVGPMLLSTEGLKTLVKYGQITENEMNSMVATGLPPTQYPYVMLEWAGLRCMDGMEQGDLRGGPGMEESLLRYFAQLRAEYFSIGDFAAGRMPMAYVQIMEILVDTLTVLAPLALYVKMGTFNIVSTGLLTLFFKGLLELSKSFLDPFGREGYQAHNIRVDVLVSEMNFGASSRWIMAGDVLPSELLRRNEPEQPPEINSQNMPLAESTEDNGSNTNGSESINGVAPETSDNASASVSQDLANEVESNGASDHSLNVLGAKNVQHFNYAGYGGGTSFDPDEDPVKRDDSQRQ